ncbi:MAG: glycosyltransferase [Lachnospiraceae bacterium]|nr:glycosyltransferase [Lachnospiraceae bacterium]
MELISVIVPVYQVKEYLAECVESLLGQTYQNIEIILIDDGSTDGSGQMCETYALADNRIKVYHQDNAGLSAARNKGLQIAVGEYIAFVDSDDYVSKEYLEKLHSLLQQYQADIAVCTYEKSEKGTLCVTNSKNTYVLDSERMLREWHGKRKAIETVVWNKLYRRSVFGKGKDAIRFPEGKEHEDTYVSHLLVQNATLVAVTESKLYMYRVRKGSITGNKVTKKSIRQDLEAQRARIRFFEEKGYIGSRNRCLIGFWLHKMMYWIKMVGRKEELERGKV